MVCRFRPLPATRLERCVDGCGAEPKAKKVERTFPCVSSFLPRSLALFPMPLLGCNSSVSSFGDEWRVRPLTTHFTASWLTAKSRRANQPKAGPSTGQFFEGASSISVKGHPVASIRFVLFRTGTLQICVVGSANTPRSAAVLCLSLCGRRDAPQSMHSQSTGARSVDFAKICGKDLRSAGAQRTKWPVAGGPAAKKARQLCESAAAANPK